MYLCLKQNASTFKIKRLCVCIETYLCFKPNAKAFFNDLQNTLRCTENSCQFENLFLTKLTG